MAITRRTERFARIAAQIDAECARLGVQVTPAQVDAVLNDRIAVVAAGMRIAERAAFVYCPDDIAPSVAAQIAKALQE